jgi:hypothetical protein
MKHTYWFPLSLLAVITACKSDPADEDDSSGDTSHLGGADAEGTGGDTSSSSTGGTAGSEEVSAEVIDSSLATAALYIAVRPTGNVILTEGATFGVHEVDQAGKTVGTNTTDFADFNWPRHVVVDDDDNVVIAGNKALYLFSGSVEQTPIQWVPEVGNIRYDLVAYGGTPKRIWATVNGNPDAPTATQIVSFDAATDVEGGAFTVVGQFEKAGTNVTSLAVDKDNNAFLVDNNGCRIIWVTDEGEVTVTAGTDLGTTNSCPFGDLILGEPMIVQGGTLAFDWTGERLLLSDSTHHAILDVTPGADGKSRPSLFIQLDEAESSADRCSCSSIPSR